MTTQTSNQAWDPPLTRPDLLTALVLSALAFGGYYAIELRLDALGAFEWNDVLFDADPNKRLPGFSHGWGGLGNRGMWHPILAYVFSLPIRAIGSGGAALGLFADADQVQRALALVLVPLIASATVAFVFCIGRLIHLSMLWAAAVAVAAGISFSHLIFGSIPDHFAIGGFSLVAAYLLCLWSMRSRTPPPSVFWIAAGVLALGITATNVVSFGLIFMTSAWLGTRSLKTSVSRSIVLVSTVAALTLVTAVTGAVLYDELATLWSPRETSDFVGKYWNTDPFERLSRTPEAVTNAVAPGAAAVTIRTDYGTDRPAHRLSFENTASIQRRLLVVPWILSGVVGFIISRNVGLPVAFASVAVLAFNLVMHTFFGYESFLYSPHWLAALVFLLAGNFLYRGRVGTLVKCAALVGLAAVAINNAGRLEQVFEVMGQNGQATEAQDNDQDR